jgi:adenylosuccinate synthase
MQRANQKEKVLARFIGEGFNLKGSFLGTTKKGIGPTYAMKAFRSGLRVGELKNWDLFVNRYNSFNQTIKEHYGINIDTEKELQTLKEERDLLLGRNMIIDSATYLNTAINQGKRVLAEGIIWLICLSLNLFAIRSQCYYA